MRGKGELVGGGWGTDDFLIRHVRGFGASTRSTPLFELLQLGGTANVRGIEQGEFVGRNMAFEQSELGVNSESLWHWIHRKKPAPAKPSTASAAAPAGATSATAQPANPPPSASPLSALGITSIFITGFYDRGKILTSSKFGDLFDLQHAFHGFGFNVELRGLRVKNRRCNLSIGYARSPNSVLHHKGAVITAFSIDF